MEGMLHWWSEEDSGFWRKCSNRVLELIADGIVILDRRGRFVFVNAEAVKILGVDRDALAGRTYDDPEVGLIAGGDINRRRARRSFTEVVEERRTVYNIEFTIFSEGRRKTLSVNAVPIVSETDEVLGIVASFTDITKRKRLEETLKRYRLLSEYARDIVLFICRDGNLIEANEAAVRVYGYSHAELRGMTIYDLRAEETLPTVESQLAKADGAGGALFETRHRRKDGSIFPVEVSSQGATIGGERVLLSIVRDITERKKAERELENKDRDIRRAYVDVIFAVTGGRLVLMIKDEIVSALGDPLTRFYKVVSFEELAGARSRLKRAIEKVAPDEDRIETFVVAASEALTNAIKHAGEGRYRVYRTGRTIQVLITDSGPGIDFKTLPKATLLAGYSTKKSLGMGFSMMLELTNRVLLSSQPGGTSVVLEISPADETQPTWNEAELM